MIENSVIGRDFSAAAAAYDVHAHLQKQARAHCLALAREIFPDSAKILDVGAGTGAFAGESKQWDITQLDLALGMCQKATQHGLAINADAAALPFMDEHFDGIFSSLMLQWANEPKRVFQEMLRVLKPAGRVVLSTLAQGTLLELHESFAGVDDAPRVNRFLSAPQIVAQAVHAGFMVLSVEEVTITEHYPDAVSLMRALKAIGATNKQTNRKKGLMTPEQLEKLEKLYKKRFSTKKGLPATWKLLYLMMEKK